MSAPKEVVPSFTALFLLRFRCKETSLTQSNTWVFISNTLSLFFKKIQSRYQLFAKVLVK